MSCVIPIFGYFGHENIPFLWDMTQKIVQKYCFSEKKRDETPMNGINIFYPKKDD